MMKKNIQAPFVLFTFLLNIFTGPLFSQIIQDEAPRDRYYMRKARVTNFWEMKDFRDMFHVDKYLLGRQRISGNLSYNFQRVLLSETPKPDYEYRSALALFTRIRFYEEISFNTTFYLDFNKRAAARWIADYTYSIGRYNWRPFKLNFGYENYQNNKYTDNADQFAEKAMEGYFFLSYGLAVPDNLFRYVRIDSTTAFRVTPFVRWAARYRDEFESVHYEGKPCAGTSARLTLFWNLYVEGAVYYYFNDVGYRQLPWDPDYSYGFGYFDYRAFRLSLTYGNWAVNRFPGKKNYFPHYGLLDGNFRLVANWQW
jgi:hypothetical protein